MENQTYVDLSAILIGTVVALAVSVILLDFGSTVGLAMLPETEWEPDTAFGRIITICLWGLWVQVLASLIGGYIAGRMRAPIAGSNVNEREMRDGIHGLAVWGLGTVLVAIGTAIAMAIAMMSPEAQEQVERAAEILRMNENAAIIAAFSSAAVSLVSAIAAWFAATKGGEHRDEGADLSRYVSFRR